MMIDRTRRFEKLIEHSRTSTRIEITARLSEEGNLCGVKNDGIVSQKGRNPSTPHYSRGHITGQMWSTTFNPNNRLVKKVLMRMVESGDYFFFAISPNQSVTAFRSEIGQKNLAGLSTNLRQIQGSTTTDAQYQRALAQFRRRPDPPGQVLNWVCRDNLSYLDLTQNRLERIRNKPESLPLSIG